MFNKDVLNGFGNGTLDQVAMLQKALEAGYAVSPADQSGGGAIRLESLEKTMHAVTFTEKQIVFWKDIAKLKANSTIEEYNTLEGYGTGGAFWAEGERPAEDTGEYQRRYAKVKYVGTVRNVTHPMTLVNTVEDAIALESRAGLRKLVKDIELALFWGNSQGAGGNEYVEWDGLFYQVDSGNVIDARSDTFDKELIDNAAQTVLDGFGQPDTMYLSYAAFSKFRRLYDTSERILLPGNEQVDTVGANYTDILTIAGRIRFKPSVLLFNGNLSNNYAIGKKQPPTGATHSSAPGAPTVSATVNASAGGNFSEGAGTYTYVVTLVNRYGESAPSTAVTAAIVNVDDTVTLTITNAGSGETPQQALIYRSEKDGSTTYLVARIPLDTATLGGTTTWTDTCDVLANTESIFMVDSSPDVIAFKQLLPTFRWDLARTALSYPFAIVLYGVPILYAPKKAVVVKNIKL